MGCRPWVSDPRGWTESEEPVCHLLPLWGGWELSHPNISLLPWLQCWGFYNVLPINSPLLWRYFKHHIPSPPPISLSAHGFWGTGLSDAVLRVSSSPCTHAPFKHTWTSPLQPLTGEPSHVYFCLSQPSLTQEENSLHCCCPLPGPHLTWGSLANFSDWPMLARHDAVAFQAADAQLWQPCVDHVWLAGPGTEKQGTGPYKIEHTGKAIRTRTQGSGRLVSTFSSTSHFLNRVGAQVTAAHCISLSFPSPPLLVPAVQLGFLRGVGGLLERAPLANISVGTWHWAGKGSCWQKQGLSESRKEL